MASEWLQVGWWRLELFTANKGENSIFSSNTNQEMILPKKGWRDGSKPPPYSTSQKTQRVQRA
jgi:hypothetical protein